MDGHRYSHKVLALATAQGNDGEQPRADIGRAYRSASVRFGDQRGLANVPPSRIGFGCRERRRVVMVPSRSLYRGHFFDAIYSCGIENTSLGTQLAEELGHVRRLLIIEALEKLTD